MADLGFNLMKADLLRDLHQSLLGDESYRAGADKLGTYVPPIAWVDDVAVPLTAVKPARLAPLTQLTIGQIHQAFRKRGLTMNLEPGKTELVVNFRGPGSVPCRKDLFLKDTQPRISVATDSHILMVRAVSAYKHLGVKLVMNLDIDKEIQARIGAARQAFMHMKRPIFRTDPYQPRGEPPSITALCFLDFFMDAQFGFRFPVLSTNGWRQWLSSTIASFTILGTGLTTT